MRKFEFSNPTIKGKRRVERKRREGKRVEESQTRDGIKLDGTHADTIPEEEWYNLIQHFSDLTRRNSNFGVAVGWEEKNGHHSQLAPQTDRIDWEYQLTYFYNRRYVVHILFSLSVVCPLLLLLVSFSDLAVVSWLCARPMMCSSKRCVAARQPDWKHRKEKGKNQPNKTQSIIHTFTQSKHEQTDHKSQQGSMITSLVLVTHHKMNFIIFLVF